MKYLVSFALLIVCSTVWGSPKIAIRATAIASGSEISLKDIAEFEGISPEQAKKLGQIKLGDAPVYGEKRTFTSAGLSEILRANLKQASFQLQIPREVTVEGAGVSITDDNIKLKIQTALTENCSDCDIRIFDLKAPIISQAAPGTTWEFRGDLQKIRGPFQVMLELWEPGKAKQVHWVTGRVQIHKKVPVAVRSLVYGERVQAGDFQIMNRDITFSADSSPNPTELIGSLTKQSIPVNQVILRSHLARQQALVRGQAVVVQTAADSLWTVSLKGIAQDGGYVGDLVRILNPDTKKVIVGVVISEGTVEVR